MACAMWANDTWWREAADDEDKNPPANFWAAGRLIWNPGRRARASAQHSSHETSYPVGECMM